MEGGERRWRQTGRQSELQSFSPGGSRFSKRERTAEEGANETLRERALLEREKELWSTGGGGGGA